MSVESTAMREFWNWFKQHSGELERAADRDAPLWDAVLEQLHRVNPDLWFEVSEPYRGECDFVVTAAGRSDLFPIADALIDEAPRIPRWRFIALKPAMGFDFITTYEGKKFHPSEMWFLPMDNPAKRAQLGLRVGFPNFDPALREEANGAVSMIIETGLGERSAALDIQHVEVGPLPHEPAEHGYMKLIELPKYIEWRKRGNRGKTYQ